MVTSSLQNRGDRARHFSAVLRRMIIAGELPPGARLRQEELARTHGISRIPVREALMLLQAQGLVLFVPNRGAVVAPLDALELRENIEMRDAAEVLAMRIALPNLSNAHIERAAAIQDEIEGADSRDHGRLNKAFHLTLYEPCGRPRLLEHIRGLHDIAERYLSFTLAHLDYTPRSSNEHRALLDACYARNTEAALSLVSQHILEAGRSLECFLDDGVDRHGFLFNS